MKNANGCIVILTALDYSCFIFCSVCSSLVHIPKFWELSPDRTKFEPCARHVVGWQLTFCYANIYIMPWIVHSVTMRFRPTVVIWVYLMNVLSKLELVDLSSTKDMCKIHFFNFSFGLVVEWTNHLVPRSQLLNIVKLLGWRENWQPKHGSSSSALINGGVLDHGDQGIACLNEG